MSPEDLVQIRAWGEAELAREQSSRSVVCAYDDRLPTKSVRSQMLTLVDEVERLGLLVAVEDDERPTLRFRLDRKEDATGVSGTGYVAWGVCFPDGTCALRWATEYASTAVYDSIETLREIHGHNGSTVICWLDRPDRWIEVGYGEHPGSTNGW